jgi:hypothetical protein
LRAHRSDGTYVTRHICNMGPISKTEKHGPRRESNPADLHDLVSGSSARTPPSFGARAGKPAPSSTLGYAISSRLEESRTPFILLRQRGDMTAARRGAIRHRLTASTLLWREHRGWSRCASQCPPAQHDTPDAAQWRTQGDNQPAKWKNKGSRWESNPANHP